MKTTIDLSEALVTEVKVRAAHERRTMKEVTAEALQKWLGQASPDPVVVDGATKNKLNKGQEKRLKAFEDFQDDLLKNPMSEGQEKALKDYLIEYREDRQTFMGRERS